MEITLIIHFLPTPPRVTDLRFLFIIALDGLEVKGMPECRIWMGNVRKMHMDMIQTVGSDWVWGLLI